MTVLRQRPRGVFFRRRWVTKSAAPSRSLAVTRSSYQFEACLSAEIIPKYIKTEGQRDHNDEQDPQQHLRALGSTTLVFAGAQTAWIRHGHRPVIRSTKCLDH